MSAKIPASLVRWVAVFLLTAAEIYAEGKDPIGYWKLDEGQGDVARDSSRQKNDGKIMNLGKYAQWVDGKAGTALDLAGYGVEEAGWVFMPGMLKKYDLTKGFTVEAWIRPKENKDAKYDWRIIVDNYSEIDAGNSAGFRFQLYRYGALFGDIRGCVGAETSPDVSFPPGIWYHVAFVYGGSSARLYVDGVQKGAASAKKASSAQFGEDIRIGASRNGYAYGFTGAIDEVKIYDYARSALDISNDALY